MTLVLTRQLALCLWASYQIQKNAGCACAGNAGNVFPRHRFKRKPLVSDPGMHHGTCVTHVPWCMSGSLTCGDGENVPGIPGACAPAILRIWQEAHGHYRSVRRTSCLITTWCEGNNQWFTYYSINIEYAGHSVHDAAYHCCIWKMQFTINFQTSEWYMEWENNGMGNLITSKKAPPVRKFDINIYFPFPTSK